MLVAFAFLFALALLPLAAYASEAAVAATRQARLQEAVAQAAEDAAGRLDVARLRRDGTLQLDASAAPTTARDALTSADPDAVVDSLTVTASTVSLSAHERLSLQLPVPGAGSALTLRAAASARLRPGYLAPL